jgi:hypothetical protein
MIQPPSSRLTGGLSTRHRLFDPALSGCSRVAPYLGFAQLHGRWISLADSKKASLRLSLHRRILGAHCGIAGCAECLTNILARWTAHLWKIQDTSQEAFPSAFYVDGHRKPVYSDVLIPGGLVGRLSTAPKDRALVLLHDAQAHPLLATTHRGDMHLTGGLPWIIERYEQATGPWHLERLVLDREGMATEFLATLQIAGRTVITLLHSNQYRDLTSFTTVGPFIPLATDQNGKVVREVAPASIRHCHPCV